MSDPRPLKISVEPVANPFAAPDPGVSTSRGPRGAVWGDSSAVPAAFWRRAAATAVDGLVILAGFLASFCVVFIVLIAILLFTGASEFDPEEAGWDEILGVAIFALHFVLSCAYHVLMECSPAQATLGKLALGLRVTDARGGRVSFARASGRFAGKLVGGMLCFVLLIGLFDFLAVLWDGEKRAVHDLLAGTRVVRAA